MVTKADKQKTLETLKDAFSKASAVFTTDQLGLSVSQITELRNKIRSHGAVFKIAKNTLVSKAAEGTQFEEVTKDLKGQTAVLFCFNGVDVEPAADIKQFAKGNEEKVVFKGAVLDGQTLNADEAQAVAGLPSKDTILSQIAGMLVQVPSSIAYILDELSKKDEDQSKLCKDFILVETESEAA